MQSKFPLGLSVQVAGTGHCVPSTRVTSEEIDTKMGFPCGYLTRASGVRSRYVCDQEDQVDMAVDACQKAITAAGLTPGDIDLVLGACAVPYQPLPAMAPLVMGRLGMADGCAAGFDVNASCLSFLTAFELAASKIALGQNQQVLVFSSEVASRALPWQEQPDVAALFGDGAGAAVLKAPGDAGPRLRASLMRSYPSHYDACQVGAGGTRFDYHNDPKGFNEHAVFRMDGKNLFRITHKYFPQFVQELLDRAEWTAADIDVVVPHQASPLALEHMVSKTDLNPDQIVDISQSYGNQIAASMPTALDFALQQGRIGSGSRVLMLGTSAGVNFGGMALDF
ncbi:ketoacyl-ACP synthase III [Parasedimentitalea marina]|uniref:Ketoacyl-ACP synthase III n=1 Tax=Parasedimentitalea marina TaxID=2483033 RepID=A0A3T0N982_9RHOB|nr:ketoacyl-ACP synthase III [Parasedimentitalea marina]AZV80541.1 ketoacyl-ACP synthase III [Parasedimentitalea marina]